MMRIIPREMESSIPLSKVVMGSGPWRSSISIVDFYYYCIMRYVMFAYWRLMLIHLGTLYWHKPNLQSGWIMQHKILTFGTDEYVWSVGWCADGIEGHNGNGVLGIHLQVLHLKSIGAERRDVHVLIIIRALSFIPNFEGLVEAAIEARSPSQVDWIVGDVEDLQVTWGIRSWSDIEKDCVSF